jgi:hypothetical protein
LIKTGSTVIYTQYKPYKKHEPPNFDIAFFGDSVEFTIYTIDRHDVRYRYEALLPLDTLHEFHELLGEYLQSDEYNRLISERG